jgi:hypothetical protein
MDEFRKEYKIKEDDINYKDNILASFGLEILNLIKECPIKIYSVDSIEFEKEDKITKEKFNVMAVTAKITKLQHKNKNGQCIKIGKQDRSKLPVRNIKKVKNG